MIKKTLIAIFLIICVGIFFAPLIISKNLGTWALEKLVASQGATLSLQKISLNWMGPQELEGIHLQLKDESVITADKITLDASLFSILTKQIPLMELNASNVSASFLEGTLQLHRMNFTAIPENENFRLNLNGLTTSDNQQGQFILEALVNPLTKKIVDASGTIDRLPVALVDKLIGATSHQSSAWLTAILGSTANLELQKRDNIVLLAVDTSTLKGKFSISMPPEGFELHNTAPLTFKASPELFHLLKKDLNSSALKRLEVIDYYQFTDVQFQSNLLEDRFTGSITGDLEGFPITVKVANSLKSLSSFLVERGDAVSIQLEIPPEPFNRLREGLYGTGSGDYLILDNTTKMSVNFEKFNFNTKELVANVVMEPLVAKNTLTGELINFPQMNGQLNMNDDGAYSLQVHAGNSDVIVTYKSAANLKLRATLNRFFYGIFSDLITGDPLIRERMEATLGNDLSGEATVSIDSGSGYLNGALKGSNGSIELSATISNDYLLLRTPFILQTKMSPLLAQTVLGPLLPFLSSGIESDQKIILRIEPDHFSVPLQNLSLNSISIGLGSLQLGRMQFINDGAIESMLSILKPAAAGKITVWFTPAYFSIHQGILSLQRLDMLAMQAYHVAIWGNLDFNQKSVDMKLGLAGTALNKAFNMPTPLTSDDMVAFPLRGPFANPSVDKARAVTQIAGLIAKLQGTPQGFIIGTFIQAAGSIGDEPIPSPTTRPFPWEGSVHPSGESAPSTNTVIKKPVKAIMRILGF